MAWPWAAAVMLAACLVALAPGDCTAGPLPVPRSGPQSPPELLHGLEALQPTMHIHTSVGTARELLLALNASAGSDQNEMITLQGAPAVRGGQKERAWLADSGRRRPPPPAPLPNRQPSSPTTGPGHAADIRIRPIDVQPFAPWLPLNGGNRTVALVGAGAAAAAAGAGDPSAPPPPPTRLDFGGAVNLLYHPAGHSFLTCAAAVRALLAAEEALSRRFAHLFSRLPKRLLPHLPQVWPGDPRASTGVFRPGRRADQTGARGPWAPWGWLAVGSGRQGRRAPASCSRPACRAAPHPPRPRRCRWWAASSGPAPPGSRAT